MRKYVSVFTAILALPLLAGCWEQFEQGTQGHYSPPETHLLDSPSAWNPGDSFFVIRNVIYPNATHELT